MACSGDSSTICGGPQALNIFKVTSADQTSQTLSNGWKPTKVCLLDNQNGRLFSGASTSSSSMTQETCTNYCAGQNLDIAGVEYGTGACNLPRHRDHPEELD